MFKIPLKLIELFVVNPKKLPTKKIKGNFHPYKTRKIRSKKFQKSVKLLDLLSIKF